MQCKNYEEQYLAGKIGRRTTPAIQRESWYPPQCAVVISDTASHYSTCNTTHKQKTAAQLTRPLTKLGAQPTAVATERSILDTLAASSTHITPTTTTDHTTAAGAGPGEKQTHQTDVSGRSLHRRSEALVADRLRGRGVHRRVLLCVVE